MATLTQRVTLNQDLYLPVDGQWAIIGSGSIIDCPANWQFGPGQVTIMPGAGTSTAPVSGVTGSSGSAASVSNVKKK